MEKKHSNPHHILFITSTYLGDAIISTTVLEELKEKYPAALFTIVCGPIAAPLFTSFPQLHQLIILRKKTLSLHWFLLWIKLVSQKWHFIVDLRGTGISNFLIYTHRKIWKSSKNISISRAEELGKFIGQKQPLPTKIYIDKIHKDKAAQLLSFDNPIIMISPAASWDKKCWPTENFIDLIHHLTDPYGLLPHAKIAILGSPSQRDSLLLMANQLPQGQFIDITGNIDLLTLAACLQRASLFVGNDSGLMHLAAAMGTPTLGLFGPSRTAVYQPFGPKASFVQAPLPYDQLMNEAKKGHNLMHLLTVDMVLESCKELLQQ